jgi:hypothetical protein
LVTEDSHCEDENANAAKFLSIRQTVPLLSQEMAATRLGKVAGEGRKAFIVELLSLTRVVETSSRDYA